MSPAAAPTAAARSAPLAVLLAHAADAVRAVRDGRSLTEALAQQTAALRPGVQALAFHALRWLGSAEAVRRQLVPKPPPPAVDALLLTALALLWPDGPPPYAEHTLVDQAVAAARQRVPAAAAFVNAVLRRFLRERDACAAQAARDPVAAYNHPAWWVERLRRDWPQDWAGLLAAANTRAPMTLRVNARRGGVAAYRARLAAQGHATTVPDGAGPLAAPQALVLDAAVPVTQLPGFAEGECSVQDVGAQLAAPLLVAGLAPGARVLDACAAPGGKTAHLLELAELDLLALDRDPARLARVGEGLQRLRLPAAGAGRVELRAGDAREPRGWWDGRPFDAILLDAPCTASGIVRRHPDVRWLRRADDVGALARTQAELLAALWPLLAPGGRLLYATCSLFRAEGQAQIDAFSQRQPAGSVRVDPGSPGHLSGGRDNAGRGTAGQGPVQHDGFFYALLHKA